MNVPSGKKRVAVIEASEANCDTIKTGLQSHGFHVEGYTDPLEAISHYRTGRYDLVLTEIRLSHMAGIDVCRRLRETDPHVRLALLTAYPDFDEGKLAELFPDLRDISVIRKPISIGQLAARIKQIIGTSS